MLSENSAAGAHGTILTKAENNSVGDLHALVYVASRDAWRVNATQSVFISCDS